MADWTHETGDTRGTGAPAPVAERGKELQETGDTGASAPGRERQVVTKQEASESPHHQNPIHPRIQITPQINILLREQGRITSSILYTEDNDSFRRQVKQNIKKCHS